MGNAILVVEDEMKIAEVVKAYLESLKYTVFCAENGHDALRIFDTQTVSMVLLDLMLPDMSGEEICRRLRQKSRVPIIMLTAKSAERDLLQGLAIGADDYITKPFSLNALGARIEAVLRRSTDDLKPLFQNGSWNGGDLEIDFEKALVKKEGKIVLLTASEYKILTLLIKYPGRVFNREQIIEGAFGDMFDGFDRTIDFHIKNIRAKIESDPRNPVYVQTVYGMGYRFGG